MDGRQDDWADGSPAYFEYRCHQSHQSADAELWYRSQRPVTVIGLGDGEDPDIAPTLIERGEIGMPRVYTIRFPDGYEGTAWEDELTIDPAIGFFPEYAPGVRPE